ncbi:MAG: methylated-DNA--[Firmicutes bacterium]|nr:methylated-DNA--[protein]-cysteine S-methyltransferase [Bacillota bacterium]
MFYSTTYPSPVGLITLASTEDALIGLWIEGQKYFIGSLKDPLTEYPDLPILTETKLWLDRYFAGEQPPISDLNLAPIGSPFRQAVWKILCEIPCGETMTYGDIAKRIAADMGRATMSAQAIGGAVGHNPISIIIPCHRVVGTNGSLTGYAGGIDKKIWLLTHEGVDMSRFTVPSKGTAL